MYTLLPVSVFPPRLKPSGSAADEAGAPSPSISSSRITECHARPSHEKWYHAPKIHLGAPVRPQLHHQLQQRRGAATPLPCQQVSLTVSAPPPLLLLERYHRT